MQPISARNLGAALAYMGADVESALLDLAAVSPALDAKVRAALYRHNKLAKLRYIHTKREAGYCFVDTNTSRPVAVMHAVDAVCRVLDDADVVQYLKTMFVGYNWQELVEQ
jgi:hypothetical protein